MSADPRLLLPRLDGRTRVTAFGVRFADPATGREVSDGLSVSLFPSRRPDLRSETFLTPGGVFALQRAPGLGSFESGDGQRRSWDDALADPRAFVVEIQDRLNRFLPVSMSTLLPTPGPFGSGTAASGLPAQVTLLSAPARSAPPSVAVVRADLHDARHPQAKALKNALLVVYFNGQEVGSGVADEQGRVAVMFSYPEPAAESTFEWLLDLGLYCARPDGGFADPRGSATLPDLQALLAQRTGAAWRLQGSWNDQTQTGTAFVAPPLQMGHELVLKTTGWNSLLASPA